MTRTRWAFIVGMLLALASPLRSTAQQGVGDVVYEPTPQVVVDEMLRMARVGPDDFVIDLGSGDGRIVITAVKKFNARGGFGVDLDRVLLRISNDTAQAQGISDRVKFFAQDLFETDLRQGTVITSYLLPSMNERLLPKILGLKPGTRIVAHDYGMGDWTPDESKMMSVPQKRVGNPGVSYVYLYVVPARVAGRWQAQPTVGNSTEKWDFEFTQRFQMIEGKAQSGNVTTALTPTAIHADQIDVVFFVRPGNMATRREFKGTVKGDVMEGTLQAGSGMAEPWTAKLVQRSATTP